jgi:hypothetical protein
MPALIAGALDRLLASALLVGARRRWPLLSLVPDRWLRPLLMPTARQLRSSLAHAVMFISLTATGVIAVLALSS